jgi:hypothetical protein
MMAEIEKRIRYFEFIKNIPYKIGLYPGSADYCCSSKSIILSKLLEGTGLQTRQVFYTFDWNETPLPPNILSLPFEKNDVTHQFMQVFIPETGQWVDCDCTWDDELEKAGFEIARWDGINPTPIAVKPHKIFTSEETAQYKRKWENPVAIKEHLDFCRDFYRSINTWLQTFRTS